MNTVILVPRRADGGLRDRLWAHCRAWWTKEFPDLTIFEGHHDDGPFNRSLALNRAADYAGDWDVAVVIDADIIPEAPRVREAIARAYANGSMVLPFKNRVDLNEQGTNHLLAGTRRNMKLYAKRRWNDNISSVFAIAHPLWDRIGGFDERFKGWGFEDTAFYISAKTLGIVERLDGDVLHLEHPRARLDNPDHDACTQANRQRRIRYEAACGHPEAIAAMWDDVVVAVPFPEARIPAIIHRVVPAQTTPEVEGWWQDFTDLHPGWTMMTHRDPLDPAEWPLTSPYWSRITSGAQLADLVRLEALLRWGGFYVDSDCEPYRPLDSLRPLLAVAAWEDSNTAPNAVLGAVPGHPAIQAALDLAIARLLDGRSIWDVGPGVITTVFESRRDVLLLPPGAFYPYHWSHKELRKRNHKREQPWCFMAHHWAGSWLKGNR